MAFEHDPEPKLLSFSVYRRIAHIHEIDELVVLTMSEPVTRSSREKTKPYTELEINGKSG